MDTRALSDGFRWGPAEFLTFSRSVMYHYVLEGPIKSFRLIVLGDVRIDFELNRLVCGTEMLFPSLAHHDRLNLVCFHEDYSAMRVEWTPSQTCAGLHIGFEVGHAPNGVAPEVPAIELRVTV